MSSHSPPIVIPTRSFYCRNNFKTQRSSPEDNGKKFHTISDSPRTKRRSLPHNQSCIHTSKGVKHKIRRRNRHDGLPLKSTSIAIDSILCNIQNDKLRQRIETERTEKQQIQKVHDILRKSQNPIELARPLRGLNMSDDSNNNVNNENDLCNGKELNESITEIADFSDSDCTTDDIISEHIKNLTVDVINGNENSADVDTSTSNLISRPVTPNEQRKFFKSGRTTSVPKEVRITGNIKALVCNGKMTLISDKKKLQRKQSTTAEFSNAQAAVDVIIKNLDDQCSIAKTKTDDGKENEMFNNKDIIDSIIIYKTSPFAATKDTHFIKLIPFNTNDPEKIEEQSFLLDFLIRHDICNEETFNIFIAKSENYRNDAFKIITDVLKVGEKDEDFHLLEFLSTRNFLTEENLDILKANRKKNLSKTSVPSDSDKNDVNVNEIPETCTLSKKPGLAVDADCNLRNLFPLFYPGQCQPLAKKFTRKSRTWHRGYGLSQYQIDAGQKEYGAKQCKQCGLVYGVHEPEEEKLHRDFHASLHVLRFKGWIDEDCVAVYPEWGRDGRIVRITDAASTKRRERLNEILIIVDKELGFSSYIIPKTFVAYIAVRNGLIVGFCLVQPLNKANKYILCNNVDCCTVAEFDAKCGVSRIWVAPLHRRMHIAKKLIQAVQMNTIAGEEIPLDKIAFSAPTEEGKLFAQKVSGTENFLVYQ